MAQVASAATNLLFVVVIAIGYIMMIRLYRQMVAVYDHMLGFMESESISLGRPLVVVYEDPEKLPNLNLVVQNVGSGPTLRAPPPLRPELTDCELRALDLELQQRCLSAT